MVASFPPLTLRETIWTKLRRGYATNRFANPHYSRASGPGPQVMGSPPTVALTSTAPSGLTKSLNAVSSPGAFYLTGGDSYTYASVGMRFPVTTITNGGSNGNVTNGRNSVGWRVKLQVDAIAPAFQLLNNSTFYRFLVDGQHVSAAGLTATNGGFNNFFQLTFSTRQRRQIWVEGDQAAAFDNVLVGPTESVQPDPSGLTMMVFGDSITAATSTGVVVPGLNDGFAYVLGDCFGVGDLRSSGSGGEGVLNPANTGAAYTLIQRLPYDARKADVYLVAMGTNDISYTSAQQTSAMFGVISYLRSNYPATPVIVLGCPGNSSGPSAATISCENAFAAAVTQWGDANNVLFIPVSTATNPMISGTGKFGATNSTGNSDLYVGSDGTHPTAAGHAYWGVWLADAIYTAISALP